jgi:hypothetical protein
LHVAILTRFYVYSSDWNGTIPTDISALTDLEVLLLNNNKRRGGAGIEGALPESLGSLGSLVDFDASGNSITGEIPSTMSDATDLETLILLDNLMGGRVPRALCDLGADIQVDCTVDCLEGCCTNYNCTV